MANPEINQELIDKIDKLLGFGLTCGLGEPEPGKMCVEALICYAMGLPHSDNPPCVGDAVRTAKIQLNDSTYWSSNGARSLGMRNFAIAQLGSTHLDQDEFARRYALRVVQEIFAPWVDQCGYKNLSIAAKNTQDFADLANLYRDFSYIDDEVIKTALYLIYLMTGKVNPAGIAYAASNFVRHIVYFGTADETLTKACSIATEILTDMGSEGSKFL